MLVSRNDKMEEVLQQGRCHQATSTQLRKGTRGVVTSAKWALIPQKWGHLRQLSTICSWKDHMLSMRQQLASKIISQTTCNTRDSKVETIASGDLTNEWQTIAPRWCSRLLDPALVTVQTRWQLPRRSTFSPCIRGSNIAKLKSSPLFSNSMRLRSVSSISLQTRV